MTIKSSKIWTSIRIKVIDMLFFSFSSQKVLNCPTNLGKGTKNLKYLVYIPKLPHQIIVYFVLEFSNKKDLKAGK